MFLRSRRRVQPVLRQQNQGSCITLKCNGQRTRYHFEGGKVKVELVQTPTVPFEPVIEYIYSTIIDMLRRPVIEDKMLLEQMMAVLYNLFPVCRETVNLISSRPLWPTLVTFANAVLERVCLFLCDGLHPSIDPLGHSKSDWALEPDIPREPYRRGHISIASVHVDRIDSARIVIAQNLDSLHWTDMKRFLMPDWTPRDCPERLGVYVGRLQYTGRALGQHRPPQHFNACVTCGRPTYWPIDSKGGYCGDRDSITTGPINDLILKNNLLKVSNSTEPYWARCGGELPGAGCVFCSRGCQDVLLNEIEAAMGVTVSDLEGSAGETRSHAKGHGKAQAHERVAMDLRAAYKRNELVARRLSSSAFTGFKLLGSKDAYVLRQQTIGMLNVDTALLYLCDRFYQTKANHVLATPCGYKGYRTNPLAYARPIAKVRAVFEKYSLNDDPLLLESGAAVQWMQRLKSQASAILGYAP